MTLWLAMRQLLLAMDAVMKAWADELGLTWNELLVMMLLAERGSMCCVDLGTAVARRKQQVHRTLGGLRRRGIVEPARHTRAGRVDAWRLTEHGRAYVRLIETRVRAWQQRLEQSTHFEFMFATIYGGVSALINRCRGGEWKNGLSVPDALRDAVLFEHDLFEELQKKERAALREAGPIPTPPAHAEGETGGAEGGSSRVSKSDSWAAEKARAKEEELQRAAHHWWSI